MKWYEPHPNDYGSSVAVSRTAPQSPASFLPIERIIVCLLPTKTYQYLSMTVMVAIQFKIDFNSYKIMRFANLMHAQ